VEAITRLVADSLARHGLDRPVDPRRLQWSRWFRCDSPHSLLVVPSKPGIFALADEIIDFGTAKTHVGTAPQACSEQGRRGCPAEPGSAVVSGAATAEESTDREGHDFISAAGVSSRRMLAVLQFSEDEDMAFTLDRMFTCINPMRARLSSGRCFLRFVVIEDQDQRRSICNALNQWLLSSTEKATGMPADFQSSLELATDRVGAADSPAHAGSATTRVGWTLLSANANSTSNPAQAAQPGRETDVAPPAPHLDSGAAKNLHCPHPLPSGF
jgi:hypothetical protein